MDTPDETVDHTAPNACGTFLVEHATDILARVSTDGRPHYVSPSVKEILGYDPRELAGRIHIDLVHPDDREDVEAQLANPPSETTTREYRVRHKDGHHVWLETTKRPVYDPDTGALTEYVLVARDVTRRKDAEERLRRTEFHYRSLVETVHAIMWRADAAGRLTFVNAEAEHILGHPVEHWLSEPGFWSMHVHPADLDRVRRHHHEAMAALRDHAYEYRVTAADGRTVWLRDTVRVIHDEMCVTGIVGITTDVTPLKEAEARARAAQRYARGLLEASPDPLFTVSPEGVVRDVNRALETLTGHAHAKLEDASPDAFVVDAAAFWEGIQRALDGLVVRECHLRFRGAEGDEKHTLVSMNAFSDGRGRTAGVLVCARDVTERLRLEAEAAAQREAAARNERLASLGILVAGVAHELNNPLMYLKGNLELALMDLADAEAAVGASGVGDVDFTQTRHGLESALRGADRIARIGNSLRTFGEGDPSWQPLDLGRVIRDVIHLVGMGLPESVDLNVHTPEEPVLVHGSGKDLQQALFHVVQNAVDAVEPAGGHVTVTCRMDADAVLVDVTDDGPGIPADAREQLFTPFFTTKEERTGLGLATAYNVVRTHGGDIEVTSPDHGGATFTVWVPLGPLNEEPSGRPPQP